MVTKRRAIRARNTITAEEYYHKLFSEEQIAQIKELVRYHTDKEVAEMVGFTTGIISRYRFYVLKFYKGKMKEYRGVLDYRKKYLTDEADLIASEELKALKEYNYQGLMKESVQARIAMLETKINT